MGNGKERPLEEAKKASEQEQRYDLPCPSPRPKLTDLSIHWVNTLEFGLTFIPDDDLYIRNPLECSLYAIAKCLGTVERSATWVGDVIAYTVGVAILPGSSIN